MTTTYKYTYIATYNGQTETGDFETDNFKATNDELVDMVINIVMPHHGPYCKRSEIAVNVQEAMTLKLFRSEIIKMHSLSDAHAVEIIAMAERLSSNLTYLPEKDDE